MCGITGLLATSGNSLELETELKKMSSFIKHRGPDNKGLWSDPNVLFKLAHQRLSIIDLSSTGNQPMISHSGRYVIALNGEIYNHRELKIDIERSKLSIPWRGHSDTEILLELIELYGIKEALSKSDGMFSIALWDRKDKSITLARDRMGEKPLYYGFSGEFSNRIFLFGSELSALTSWKGFNNKINIHALSELLSYGAISAPNSIYNGINQLPPGHIYTLNYPSMSEENISSPWWSFTKSISKSLQNQFSNEEEALETLEATLLKSIQQQSIADVELGSFLSGGIDSTLITALLQSISNKKIRTFTIGFEESKYDESTYAKAIANHLGTEHSETILTAKDALNIIPNLYNIYSEPFADSSQIATHLVCKEAHKNGLKVALSGDGGDELFGGYNRYFLGPNIWSKISTLPFPIRKVLGKFILSMPSEGIDIFSQILKINQLGQKSHKLAKRMNHIDSNDELYLSLIKEWHDPYYLINDERLINIHKENPYPLSIISPEELGNEPISKMMFYDTLNYLPNDILTKVDRAAMASSLETRAPFLDHKILDCAWRIPLNMKIKSNKNIGKVILRKILNKYIPIELIERPKMGFGVPIGEWLRGPLKPWADELLSQDNIQKHEFIKPNIIRRLYAEHQSRKYDHTAKLWHILMWQSWILNTNLK